MQQIAEQQRNRRVGILDLGPDMIRESGSSGGKDDALTGYG
jgi:hypothetical protein